eukprot:6025939-Pyramimonas_sp.AAC.2
MGSRANCYAKIIRERLLATTSSADKRPLDRLKHIRLSSGSLTAAAGAGVGIGTDVAWVP